MRPAPAESLESALRLAVLRRDEEGTRVLMRLGANARAGTWPHFDATSAHAIAVDREYAGIVAVIEQEEEHRRASLGRSETPPNVAVEALRQAILEGRAHDAVALMAADPALVGACDVHGITPLHLAAWKHDPTLVGWLLDQGAPPDALAVRDSPVRRHDQPVLSGKTPLDFAAIVAGQAPSGRDSAFHFMENARVGPGRFEETARRLLEKGAELTPRAAVALGDRESVLRRHREFGTPNEVHLFRGGLLAIAVRVDRPEMVVTLLDLGLDPDESIVTSDGDRSWGMPLWFASMCGRLAIAELLLARGADVNAIVHACGDSLCVAEDEPMRALLRKHGARLTVETVTDPKIARAVLDGDLPAYSLNIDEPTQQDFAEVLMCGGDSEIVRMCLPYLTRRRDDPFWNQALVKAASLEALKLILESGVDPDVADAEGMTVLHHLGSDWCQPKDRLLRATMMLDAGASLNKRDPLVKSTPLGWACRWGRIELVKHYLERGADPVEAGADSWAKPLAWAMKRGHQAIVELLRSHGAT